MKNVTKTVLIVISLLLSVGAGFAAEVKLPATAVGDAVKADTKAAVGTAKETAQGKGADVKAVVKAALVDVNSATEAQLKAIPGIGDVYAAKIIAGRPYANKTQLKSRNVIPAAVYEQVKEKIIAKLTKK